MAKYLDRKAVLKALKTLLADENDYSDIYHDGYVDGVYDAEDAVKDLPSEDVVKVVRCKDCKWYNKIGCAINIVDESDKPNEDDFCSFAERGTDESN